MTTGMKLLAAAMLLAAVTTIIGCVDMPTNPCGQYQHDEPDTLHPAPDVRQQP